MKLRLTAFFFCALSLTMILGAYGFTDWHNSFPPARYGGGKAYSLDLPIMIMSLLSLASATVGGVLLIKDARAGGRAARTSKLFRYSLLCLVPTIVYSISAYVLPLIRPW